MARGGKRAGAGRKPNAAGKKAREVSDLTHGGRRAGAGRTLGVATKKTRAPTGSAARTALMNSFGSDQPSHAGASGRYRTIRRS